MKTRRFLYVLLAIQVCFAKPVVVSFTTYLTDTNNKPKTLNGQAVQFKLFSDSTGGTALWEEQHGVIAPNGFVSVLLGSREDFPMATLRGSGDLWLEMQIIGEDAFPRQRIATNFFTLAANYADSASHARKADSATHSSTADTALYAKGGSAVVHAQSSDTAHKAGNATVADSAGKAGNAAMADSAAKAGSASLSDSAAKAGNALSLGGTQAADFAKTADIAGTKVNAATLADSAIKTGTATNAEKLGDIVASRYLATDTDGKVAIGTTAVASGLTVKENVRGGAFYTKRKGGTIAPGATLTEVVDGLANRTSYFVTATLWGPNCEICKTALVSTTIKHVIPSVTQLNGTDYMFGTVTIRTFDNISPNTYNEDGGNKVEVIYDASDVPADFTPAWTWTITQVSSMVD